MAAAEHAVNQALLLAPGAGYQTMQVGEASAPVTYQASGAGDGRVTVARLQDNVYAMFVEARAAGGGGREVTRRVRVDFRLLLSEPDSTGASIAAAAVRVKQRAWTELY
jgi:hypothetical protein